MTTFAEDAFQKITNISFPSSDIAVIEYTFDMSSPNASFISNWGMSCSSNVPAFDRPLRDLAVPITAPPFLLPTVPEWKYPDKVKEQDTSERFNIVDVGLYDIMTDQGEITNHTAPLQTQPDVPFTVDWVNKIATCPEGLLASGGTATEFENKVRAFMLAVISETIFPHHVQLFWEHLIAPISVRSIVTPFFDRKISSIAFLRLSAAKKLLGPSGSLRLEITAPAVPTVLDLVNGQVEISTWRKQKTFAVTQANVLTSHDKARADQTFSFTINSDTPAGQVGQFNIDLKSLGISLFPHPVF